MERHFPPILFDASFRPHKINDVIVTRVYIGLVVIGRPLSFTLVNASRRYGAATVLQLKAKPREMANCPVEQPGSRSRNRGVVVLSFIHHYTLSNGTSLSMALSESVLERIKPFFLSLAPISPFAVDQFHTYGELSAS